MTILELLETLDRAGVHLEWRGLVVGLRGPWKSLPTEVIDAARAHKAELRPFASPRHFDETPSGPVCQCHRCELRRWREAMPISVFDSKTSFL